MTAAAEKVDSGKMVGAKGSEDKGTKGTPAPEKRRALGRGLEALLPGPRAVGAAHSSQVSDQEHREPGAPSSSGAVSNPPSSTERLNGAPWRDVPTLSQSARKDGAPGDVRKDEVPERVGDLQASAETPRGEPIGDLQGVAESDSSKSAESFDGVEVRELPLELIDKNPYQTRHFTQEDGDELIELGKSIQAQGLIQPITVREGKNGRYTLIAGDRRTRASKWAGLKTIPAIIWEVSEQAAAEMTVIENLMREDLNCMDQTRAFVLLSQKFHMTQAQIADRVGMSRESVSNYMRLARLPSEVQDYLINGELEFSHARQLLKLEDDAMVLKVAQRVVKERIAVWELEEMMLGGVPKEFKAPDEEKKARGARWVDPNVKAAQRDLERVLGMRVRIRDRNNKGRIQIEYSNLEDFDRVVGMLKGK